ncbi:MAG: hypothetical protein V2J13_04250 [Cycloclasticus sp.]|nr:hypothetical protein [Cycloclasticus sp.]
MKLKIPSLLAITNAVDNHHRVTVFLSRNKEAGKRSSINVRIMIYHVFILNE